MKLNRWWLRCLLVGVTTMPASLQAQQSAVPDWFLRLPLPNAAGKSIVTPAAWGAAYGVAFAGAGLTNRAPYLNSTDGVVAMGVGLGDPVLSLGLQVTTTMADLGEANTFSLSFKLHRYLGAGTAIAFGAENLFSDNEIADDFGDSYFAVLSHTFQGISSARSGVGRVHASVGVGSGRFANRSSRDISEGKGEHGTYVFGNAALEVQPDLNLIVEWSGINLHAGAAFVLRAAGQSIGLSLSLADLTRYSGDGVRVVGGGAVGVSF